MTIIQFIGLTWFVYALGFGWLAGGMARRAREVDGPIHLWPSPGRWLLSLFCWAFTLICLESARFRLAPDWFDDNSWPGLIIRLIPIPPLVWMAWRTSHGGLFAGTSIPNADTPNAPPPDVLVSVGLSDNARRSIRCALQFAVAWCIHGALERYGVYDITGFWQTGIVLALYAAASNMIWNTIEDKIGMRFIGPLDHRLGDAVIEEGKR